MSASIKICPAHQHEMEKDGSRWVCGEPGCDVVCHNGPTSTPADAATRAARSRAHMVFDPLWRKGSMSRDEAYDRMADYMGLDASDCHIGMFDSDQCRRVHNFITDLFVGFGFEDVSRETRKMSLLDQVKPARRQRPPRIVLTGTEKIGKSTFAAGFKNPVFIPIDKEEGIDSVDADAFPVAKTFAEVKDAIRGLVDEDHEYKTVVIDSMSALSPLVMTEAMRVENVSKEKELGGGYGREFNTPNELWGRLMTGLDLLRDRGMTVILIAHIKKAKFEDPLSGDYTIYDIDMPAKGLAPIKRWADSILFANWEVFRKSENAGFNKETHRAVGQGKRSLFTQARPSHPGGGRGVYGELPYELPFSADAFREAVLERMREIKAESAAEESVSEPDLQTA